MGPDHPLSSGLWQAIPISQFDYAKWRDRLNNATEEERIQAALRYMRGIIMASPNDALRQGEPLNMENIYNWRIPEGQVALLHSGWGVEGVFTDAERLLSKINQLRSYAAYRDEPLSISMMEFNPIV